MWYFGNGAAISFNTSTGKPVALTNSQMITGEGSASIATSAGRLLFYTDGIKIWDSTHTTMPNGTGLNGNGSSTQSAVVVQRPDSAHIYYVFTVDELAGSKGLCYSEVNMKLNSGKGNVVSGRKNIFLTKNTAEKITAVKHANGRDFWVLTVKYYTDSIYAYLVTPSGVNSTPIKSRTKVTIAATDKTWTRGNLKASPDGTKIAYVSWALDSTILADFNTSTGFVTNVWTVHNPVGYGCEFSPKSKYLYATELNNRKIFQYDAKATTRAAFRSSKKCIDSGFTNICASLQLGPDGKIYVSEYNIGYLHVIHAPDSFGFSSRRQRNYINLSGKGTYYGLPTFIQSFFQKKAFQYTRNCLRDSTFFTITDLTILDSVKWIFDDTASGANNISKKTTNVYHIFKKKGYYTVSLISYYKAYKDTTKVKFYVKDAKPYLGTDTVLCNTLQVSLKPQNNYLSYKWNTDSTKKILNITNKGIYILKAKDSAGCFDSDTIEVKNPQIKAAFRFSDTLRCFNSNSFTFKDTSSYTDEIWKRSTWYFGDGTTKIDTFVKKVYADTGVFMVKLVLESKKNCKDSVTKKVVVLPSAKIAFNINKDNQCLKGNAYYFMNASTISKGSIAAYAWSFGDDSVSAKKDVLGKAYLNDSTYKVTLIATTDRNCKDTLSKTVIVYPNAKVNFTPSKISQCFKHNLTNFVNSTSIRTGAIGSYTWNLGDNTSSSQKEITAKTYSSADSFNVSLLSISDKGCRDSVKETVYIWNNSLPAYTVNKTAQCFKGHSFNFTNTSTITNGSISYYWQFGDDSTSDLQHISGKTYLKDSIYQVMLVTTSDRNCRDTVVKTVSVCPNAKVVFLPSKTSQCFNYNTTSFINLSVIRSGSIASYNWHLGDKTFSAQKDVVNKKYATPDSFKVSLLTISDKGCRDSLSRTVYLFPNTQVAYQVNKDTQCFEWNRFDYTNTSVLSKGTMLYAWDLGDYTTDTSRNIQNKKYALFGSYKVRLVTTTDKNCKDTMQKSVTVHASPVTKYTVDNARQCFRGNIFDFTNNSGVNNGSIVSQDWDLGNGQNRQSANVMDYSYALEDTFDIRLISRSDKGCYDTASGFVVTSAQPVAKFIIPNDSQCWQKHYFKIINQTTLKYGQMQHTWNFGDGTFNYDFVPLAKTYANKSAKYTVKYKVVSDHGCSDSLSHHINLLERPISAFDINDSVQCFRNHLFSFVNKTTFSAMNTLTYYWDYGNGNSSLGITPQTAHYPKAQYYPVSLVSYSYLTNCYDTLITMVLPAPHAQPAFTIDADSQCLRFNLFNFTNQSTLAFGTMGHYWNFGDMGSSSQKNPVKHYTAGSAYTVKLVVSTNHNCRDSVEKPLVLVPHPKAAFSVNDTSQCLNGHGFDMLNKTTFAYGTYASKWLFDDATSDANKDVSAKQFRTGGKHKIILTVLSGHNCTDTTQAWVNLEMPKNTGIQMTGKDSQCLRSNSFNFQATGKDPNIGYAGYTWYFGDSETSSSNPSLHKYKKEGPMDIMLETVSLKGCKDTAYYKVVINPHPETDFSADSVCFPASVEFVNKSGITPGAIVAYMWDFGDGSNSTAEHPVRQYKMSGRYDIRLVAISASGCRDTLDRIGGVWVRAKPTALFDFTTLPSKEFELTSLQLNNKSFSDIVSNNWDFGNGTWSVDKVGSPGTELEFAL